MEAFRPAKSFLLDFGALGKAEIGWRDALRAIIFVCVRLKFFMRGEENLCAIKFFYARLESFMRD